MGVCQFFLELELDELLIEEKIPKQEARPMPRTKRILSNSSLNSHADIVSASSSSTSIAPSPSSHRRFFKKWWAAPPSFLILLTKHGGCMRSCVLVEVHYVAHGLVVLCRSRCWPYCLPLAGFAFLESTRYPTTWRPALECFLVGYADYNSNPSYSRLCPSLPCSS